MNRAKTQAIFPNDEIVSALSRQLSWSHFLEVIYLTVLPPPDVPYCKLHEAIETARARIEAKGLDVGLGKPA